MTNLIFFARHPELPKASLDPKGPNFKKLSAEWTKILNNEVWKAIEASAENLDLVVSGKEVTDHHRRFFVGNSGKRLGKDIFVREAVPVRAYQTKRNATVRTAQAMRLSDWVFGIPVPAAATSQPELEESESWNEEQSGYYDVYSELEGESGDDSESAGFEDSYVAGDRDHYEGNFDLERLDISEFQVEPVEEELVEEELVEEELDARRVREEPDMRQDEQPVILQYDLPQRSTQVVVVGQRIELDLNNIESAKESEDIKWIIPGVVVRDYDGTAKDAKLFKFTDADLRRPKISFFWVDAADGRVVLAKFRLKSGGLGQVAFAFDVKGPTVSAFTARTDVTRLEKSHGLIGMRFGKLVESPGIKWHWKISLPPTHDGYIKDVQTVLNDRTKILLLRPGRNDTRKLVWRHPSKTDPHVQVDGDPEGPEYTKGLSEEKRAAGSSFTNKGTSDSPRTDIPSLAKTVSINDQFTYYVMFKPAMKKDQDAIWVPIAKANWFWKVTATRRDKKWLLSQPKPKMEATITLAAVDFPIYETNAFENEWQEVSP